MHTLRHCRLLACWLLAWLTLSVGAAVAAPWVQPQSLQLVCSGSGPARLMDLADDATPERAGHTLDCPLCLPMGAAPPTERQAAALACAAQPHALQRAAPSRAAARPAPPLPARGPPCA